MLILLCEVAALLSALFVGHPPVGEGFVERLGVIERNAQQEVVVVTSHFGEVVGEMPNMSGRRLVVCPIRQMPMTVIHHGGELENRHDFDVVPACVGHACGNQLSDNFSLICILRPIVGSRC